MFKTDSATTLRLTILAIISSVALLIVISVLKREISFCALLIPSIFIFASMFIDWKKKLFVFLLALETNIIFSFVFLLIYRFEAVVFLFKYGLAAFEYSNEAEIFVKTYLYLFPLCMMGVAFTIYCYTLWVEKQMNGS